MRAILSRALVLAAISGAAASTTSAQMVFPTGASVAFNFIPFGSGSATLGPCVMHQVFASTLFSSATGGAPALITEIAFAPNTTPLGASDLGSTVVRLGYTSRTPGVASTAGGLSLPAAAGGGVPNATGAMTDFYVNPAHMVNVVAGGATNFEVVLPGTGFVYDPALGNLLVEIISTNLNTTFAVSRAAGSAESSRAYTGGRFAAAESPTTATRFRFTFSIAGTTGACCRIDGSCGQATQSGCIAVGGTYRGDGVACANANCPAGGACCLPDLTCTIRTSAACTSQNGTYRGDGTACATANCPTPGACCLPLGVCNQTTPAACTAQGGIYRGDSTACASANCPGGVTMVCNIPGTFTDISATGTPIVTGDDATGPFTSSVTNALVTNPNLFACTNGFISNSSTFTAFTNTTLPTASATFGLFPNWDDLFVDPATVPPGSLVHQAVVESGVPVHIIQWNMVRTFAGGATPTQGTFQVKIFGAGGPALVQYLYQAMAWDWNGNSSTVGVQWSPSNFYQQSYSNSNTVPPPPGQIPDNSVCSIIQIGGPACYPNCDGSTTIPCLNVLDFSCFLNKFAANDSYANCDLSTTPPVLNVLDFSCFLNRFAAGCSSC